MRLPLVIESKKVSDSGFRAVDSGFMVLDSGFFFSGIWIWDSNRLRDSRFQKEKYSESRLPFMGREKLFFAEWMSCITFLFKISFFLCLQGYSNTFVTTRDWKLCPIQWLCMLQPSKRALYLCKKFWETGKYREKSQQGLCKYTAISENQRKMSSFCHAAPMSLPVPKLRLLIICSEAKADLLWGVRNSSYKYLPRGVSYFKKVNAAASSVSRVFVVASRGYGGRQELYKIERE